MGASRRSRVVTLLLFLVAGASLIPLFSCTTTDGGIRLPARRSDIRAAQRAAHQSFDLMPPSSNRRPPATARGQAGGGVRVSPDGKWIAFESDRGGVHGVWVAERDGGNARRVSGGQIASMPVWSPDASRLVFAAREFRQPDTWSVRVVQMPAGRATRLAWVGEGAAAAAWLPDSRRVCYGATDRLVILDTFTGAQDVVALPDGTGRIAGAPAVSPDGSRVVFAVAGGGAWIASLADHSARRVVAETDVDAFAWAPGGRQFAFRSAHDGQWKLQPVNPD